METFNPTFNLTSSFHGGFEKTTFELGVLILNNEVLCLGFIFLTNIKYHK